MSKGFTHQDSDMSPLYDNADGAIHFNEQRDDSYFENQTISDKSQFEDKDRATKTDLKNQEYQGLSQMSISSIKSNQKKD